MGDHGIRRQRTGVAALLLAGALGLSGALAYGSLAAGATAAPGGGSGSSDFTNTPLIATGPIPDGWTTAPYPGSTGDSEPAVAFGRDGAMAVGGLAWIADGVNLWRGSFGATPGYFGRMDAELDTQGSARTATGGHDQDLEFTAAGTLLLADLDSILNPTATSRQLGLNVTRCPVGATSPAACDQVYLDQAGADRQFIATAGTRAWVAYHDAQASTLIRVKRSDDDGRTWTSVGSPIPGQGAATGDATFNNDIGPIVADAATGVVYAVYAAGEPQTKAGSIDRNNIYVSRSTDGGEKWTSALVYHAPPGTQLANIFPALALDPATHVLYTGWADETHGIYVSASGDAGRSWSAPTLVSTARTTVMPSIAARDGKVDVVYYGSGAASIEDPAAVWNVYDSQLRKGRWSVKQVSQRPNRVGAICLEGSACTGDRQLLDLFEVAEHPVSNRAAVVYADSTMSTYTRTDGVTRQLPEIVLAYER